MDTYNGYRNYETWLVKLWIDNDECQQREWVRQATEFNCAYDLSKHIEEQYDDLIPTDAEIMTDLLRSAVSRVNWYEIAESLIADAQELADEEQEYEDALTELGTF